MRYCQPDRLEPLLEHAHEAAVRVEDRAGARIRPSGFTVPSLGTDRPGADYRFSQPILHNAGYAGITRALPHVPTAQSHGQGDDETSRSAPPSTSRTGRRAPARPDRARARAAHRARAPAGGSSAAGALPGGLGPAVPPRRALRRRVRQEAPRQARRRDAGCEFIHTHFGFGYRLSRETPPLHTLFHNARHGSVTDCAALSRRCKRAEPYMTRIMRSLSPPAALSPRASSRAATTTTTAAVEARRWRRPLGHDQDRRLEHGRAARRGGGRGASRPRTRACASRSAPRAPAAASRSSAPARPTSPTPRARSRTTRRSRSARRTGIEYEEVQVANDGLTVVANTENDRVDCLTIDQLKTIWNQGSKVKNWKEVDPKLPGRGAQLFGPGTDSGTFDYFTDAINGEEGVCAHRLPDVRGRQRARPGRVRRARADSATSASPTTSRTRTS